MKVEGRETGTFQGSLRGGAESSLPGDGDQGFPCCSSQDISRCRLLESELYEREMGGEMDRLIQEASPQLEGDPL
jgi:hypothetical protein